MADLNKRNLLTIARKDLSGLANEKTIVLAILLQLFVAMFSSFLMIGLTSLYDPSFIGGSSRMTYAVGYVGNDSPLRELLEKRNDIVIYDVNLSTGIASLKDRQLSAVLYLPDFPPGAEEPVKITVYTVRNDIMASVINAKLKEIFMDYEEELRTIRSDRLSVTPVPMEFPGEQRTTFYEFVYSLLIPLLLFMPAVISSALVIDLITEEFQHHTLDTLLSAPVTMTEMVWGKVLACFILIPIQAIAWLVLLFINGIVVSFVPIVLAWVLLASLALILVGALTALYYRERTAAQVIFSLAIVVLLIFGLSVAGNPFNQVAVLATGTVLPDQFPLLAFFGLVVLVLGVITHRTAMFLAPGREKTS